ncbi:type II secretion system protein [Geminisphaera colitermitum]|uniref:type II secretion system protein n=1 Tax=Geminisphaera colitermitum TaxID=1148786 RepID=UPI000158D4D5|nr:type II secretion system protein [Geminisphaera colitermitum]
MPSKSAPNHSSSFPQSGCHSTHYLRIGGFTLIELLTVIAIIGILSAITLGAIGQVRSLAKQTKCAATLRGFGIGIQLYTNDHNGRLPGPTGWSQASSVAKGHYGLLAHVAPYLSYELTGKELYADSFICAAIGKDPERKYHFTANQALSNEEAEPTGTWVSPWGDTGATSGNERRTSPMDLVELAGYLPLSRQWAICDRYASKRPRHALNVSALTQSPPSHRNKLNVLYFDWHVETQ